MNSIIEGLVGRIVMGQARHYITLACGGLVAKGLWDKSESEQAVGAIMTLIPLILDAYSHYKAEQDKNAAILQAAHDVRGKAA